MNPFSDVLSKLTGGASAPSGGQGLAGSILEMLNSREGGIAGLASAFQQNGLGEIVSSWIGTGQNLPVSAEQIQQVLGSEQIQALAQKLGISPETAAPRIAELLPGIVDKLTPGGEVPEGGDLLSRGLGLLQGLTAGNKPDV